MSRRSDEYEQLLRDLTVERYDNRWWTTRPTATDEPAALGEARLAACVADEEAASKRHLRVVA